MSLRKSLALVVLAAVVALAPATADAQARSRGGGGGAGPRAGGGGGGHAGGPQGSGNHAVPRGSVGHPGGGGYYGHSYYGRPYYPYYGRPYYPYYGYYGYPYYYPGFSFSFWYGSPGYYGYYGAYGYPYGPYGAVVAAPGYVGASYGGVRIAVPQRNAEVYSDGYFLGTVDQFDGTFQQANLEPGAHRIEVRAPGFQTLDFDVNVEPGRTITYRTAMRPVQP